MIAQRPVVEPALPVGEVRGGPTPDAAAPIDRIPDVHAEIPCGLTWQLPIPDPRCEAACVPKPELVGPGCLARHPNGAYTRCTGTFLAHDVDGDVAGCCALYGTPTEPAWVMFLACPIP